MKMADKPDPIQVQLKEACKLCGAAWAGWLVHNNNGWEIFSGFGITTDRRKAAQAFWGSRKMTAWLAGALNSGRARWQETRELSTRLKAQRVYIYPNTTERLLLVVGADRLDGNGSGVFRILAANPPSFRGALDSPSSAYLDSAAPKVDREIEVEGSYLPQNALENTLDFLAEGVSCNSAYLAVRSGEVFRIQVCWHLPAKMHGVELSINEDKALNQIIETHQGLIISQPNELPSGLSPHAREWMGVPFVIGQRVIGITAFVSNKPGLFSQVLLQRTEKQAARLVYYVENAIVFAEVSRYLQQMALLNELATTVSMGLNMDEVARRVMQRLRRVFGTDWSAVLLLTPDGSTLVEYGGGSSKGPPWVLSVSQSLTGEAVVKGKPIRVGNIRKESPYPSPIPDLRSELAVPLKYRGKVIGAISLVSEEVNAFSARDEQLLVVIASHLAGLFENVRITEELRQRAQKLQDSVRQLRAVRETALEITSALDLNILLKRIANRARELTDAHGAEVGLYDPESRSVQIVVSEMPWTAAESQKIPMLEDVAGRVAAFGEPVLVSNYSTWSERILPERSTLFKSVAGVPLKFRGEVIGTLIVIDDRPERIFQQEDMDLLELLAPQAAISIRNARLYQELQERIEAQHLAESRLVRSARLAAVGEMAAGVAHELNNPLTTVAGFVELILEEIPQDFSQRPDLELVLQEALRARGVVRRLLDFSRPAEDQRLKTDLNDLVLQVIALVNHLSRTGGVTIQTELEKHLPWVVIDPNQIKQVLLNLMHNALQAMPGGGTLTISTGGHRGSLTDANNGGTAISPKEGDSKDLDWLFISVRDTGEGISPRNMERLFEPFFTTRPANRGTGLGLSVSYGIITSHGGTIEVESQLGNGSSFTVYLPLHPPVSVLQEAISDRGEQGINEDDLRGGGWEKETADEPGASG